MRLAVAKGGTTNVVSARARAATSATSARPCPMLATMAPPAASRMRSPYGVISQTPSVRATVSGEPPRDTKA